MSEKIVQQGTCKFCKNLRMIETEEDLTQAELDRIATEECDCPDALVERNRRIKIEAAREYINNEFDKAEQQDVRGVFRNAVDAVIYRRIEAVSVKMAKHTYKVDRDSDGDIRIQRTFKETLEETF